jgi:hypothetical protein
MATNLYAPPKSKVADIVEGEAAPPLWNPGAAASWSLFFSPAFGAFLHMKNWEALGEPEKAASAKRWIVIYLATLIAFIVASTLLPHNTTIPLILRLSGFGLLLAWYYASGKPQVDFVKVRFGKDYPRRGWAQPILIAVGAIIGFILFVGVVAGVMAAALRHA